jgi:hypothetical protein
MTRLLIPLLILAASMPAAEGKGHRKELGAVLGRQVVDAGHVLEVRAVAGQAGQVLIRWGDVDDVIAKGTRAGAFAWSGSATGDRVRLVRVVAFEDGSKGKSDQGNHGAKRQDRLTSDDYAGNVSWETKTFGHWDGVVVQSASGSNVEIASGPAKLSVKVP